MTLGSGVHRLLASLLARPAVRRGALLLVSLVTLATAAYSYRDINHELTAVALSRRETVARLAAVTLAEKFGRATDVAVSLSTRVRFRELVARGRWLDAVEIMREVPGNLPHIERIFLADVTGTLKADVPALPGVRGADFAHRDWFKGVSREWRPYVSPVYIRAAEPRLKVFAVAAPIRSAGRDVVGILVAQIRVESLLEWVAGIDLGPGGFVYIVDPKGQLAFHSAHPDRGDIADASKMPAVEKLRHGANGVEIGFDPESAEDAIVGYATVPGYGWGVVVQQPARASPELMARSQQLRRLLTGYAIILLLGGTAILLVSQIASASERAREDQRIKAELEQRVAERTSELEVANKELEAFSYSVSHDLRAPLRSIDGFGQALLEDCADRLDDRGRHYLDRIRGATQRMGQLIDDLLQLSRAARAEMRREPVDLTQLANAVLAELQKAEPERKVAYRVQEGMVVEGDLRLLRIALENLLGNAWKFTRRAEHAQIEVGSFRDADGARAFWVRDNGVGFDMAYAGKLFGAFQRLHAPADFPGTGIGLATVQRIIHRHGGRVWAESEDGKGATFYFALGRYTQPAPQEKAA